MKLSSGMILSVTGEVAFAVLTLQTFIPEINAFIPWVIIPIQKKQDEIKKKKKCEDFILVVKFYDQPFVFTLHLVNTISVYFSTKNIIN